MNPNRFVNAPTPSSPIYDGFSPQITMVPGKPPGTWWRINLETGEEEEYDLPSYYYSHGVILGVRSEAEGLWPYVQLYVYIDNPYDPNTEATLYSQWDNWKKVDLDYPKIDPRTGEPFDQFLEWYSPLAE